ncbi:hypothetical protein ACQP1O_18135 [Nocardia sp. CA-151230]|uniref:hypothetical protein n=1 Tax=Nocardia sp. CA-151230 TaxID=3239982 RepID=UPI003D8E77ED
MHGAYAATTDHVTIELWNDGEQQSAEQLSTARMGPHFNAMVSRMFDIRRALYADEIVWLLPRSDWADVPDRYRPIMVMGCTVAPADIDAPMIGVIARSGQD